MMDDLYQSKIHCDVCGTEITLPDQDDWPDPEYDDPIESVLESDHPSGKKNMSVECGTCGVSHRISVSRMDRPVYWTVECTAETCNETREITWEGMQSKSKPFIPSCELCGSLARLAPHYG